ncbi:MAG: apolipoprotein N-acyltransferase [Rhodovibrionaceae bacterium]
MSATEGRLNRLAQGIAGLEGWRAYGLAFLLGLTAAAALPPVYLLPLLIPAFCGWVWLLEGAQRARQAFFLTLIFASGFFVAGLYWVGIAMTVDLAKFGWFLPIAVGGLSILLAIFHALTVTLAWIAGFRLQLGAPSRVLLYALAWLIAEWLRSFVLSGFPWNQLGSVWTFHPLPMQGAALLGIWGLSLVTLLAAISPAMLAFREEAPRARLAFIAGCYGLLVLLLAGGGLRLALAPEPGTAMVPDVRFRLVQASIPQKEKWDGRKREEHLQQQFALTTGPGIEEITDVIWPETAIPYLLRDTDKLGGLTALLAPEGGLFIAGMPRIVDAPEGSDQAPEIFNSLLAANRAGEIQAIFDKFHLVPFGEYVPFRSIVSMAKLTPGNLDFTPGPGPQTLSLPGLPPVSPLICYEVIFSGEVVEAGAPRPRWFLNLTNDAWFGDSSGPYQHFAAVRLRAVEEGLPMVRSANNGISAVVDPYGRVLQRLGLNEVGVLDSGLPQPVETVPPYAYLGAWAVAILSLLTGFGAALLRRFP